MFSASTLSSRIPSSTTGAPAPLVPDDCDLRGLPEIPLDIQWFQQVFLPMHAATNTVYPAMRIWLAAWQQCPAGSLPNDDALLSAMAGYQRVGKSFQKAKAHLLQGWVLCSDDRWYHPVLAEKIQQAASAKAQRSRSAQAAAKSRWTAARGETAARGNAAAQGNAAQGTAAQSDSAEIGVQSYSGLNGDASRMRDGCVTHTTESTNNNENNGAAVAISENIEKVELKKPRRKQLREMEGSLRNALLAVNLPEGLSLETWTRFVDFRAEIKSPLTLHARDMVLKELVKLRNEGSAPEDVIAQSIISGWKGVFQVRKGFSSAKVSGRSAWKPAAPGSDEEGGPSVAAVTAL